MRKYIEPKHIKLKQWKATLNYVVCGDVASLILPSYTISSHSQAAAKCDVVTGALTLPKGNKFLRESTLRELDDNNFRTFAYENAVMVATISHNPSSEFGLSGLLATFAQLAPQKKIRICYGGDLIEGPNSLKCVLDTAAKFPDKKFLCCTSNGSALAALSIEAACGGYIIPPNVFIFCEDGGDNDTELFPYIHRSNEGTVEDSPDFFPETRENIEMKINQHSADRRQKQVSWWQPSKIEHV